MHVINENTPMLQNTCHSFRKPTKEAKKCDDRIPCKPDESGCYYHPNLTGRPQNLAGLRDLPGLYCPDNQKHYARFHYKFVFISQKERPPISIITIITGNIA